MRASKELRRRWRSVLVITLLVGIFGTIVFVAAAGARRSDSALRRFNEFSHSSELEVQASEFTPGQLAHFAKTTGVAAFAEVNVYAMSAPVNPALQLAAAADEKLGTVVDHSRIISGRRANPNAPDEITIGESLAHKLGLHLGDTIATQSLTPEQMKGTFTGKDPGPPKGPALKLRIVGIERRPLDLGDLGAVGGVVVLTPAFDREYGPQMGRFVQVLRVRVDDPARNLGGVVNSAHQLWGNAPYGFQAVDQSLQNHGAADAVNLLTVALWIFAAVVAVASLVVIGVILSREFASARDDQGALQAIGMTRSQRTLAASARAIFIALGGVLVAIVGAIAASPLLPVGVARRADPNVGIHADWMVLGLGAGIIVVFVLTVATLSAFRAASSPVGAAQRRVRRQPVVDIAAEAGLRPTITHGLRMALQPTRGETAVPRGSTFLGVAFSVAGIAAILVFSASLAHLTSTPARYGAPYDFKGPDAVTRAKCSSNDGGVARVPGVTDIAAVCFGPVAFGTRQSVAWTFLPIRGTLRPEVIEGRAPAQADEVALGTTTMHALHTKIGSKVEVSDKNLSYRVVGRAVFPRLLEEDVEPLADGALFSREGFRRANVDLTQNDYARYIVGRFAPDTKSADVLGRLNDLKIFHRFGDVSSAAIPLARDAVVAPGSPPEVDRLHNIGWFPPLLALLLSVLAFMAVAAAIFASVRRRRRELAMLKTLGFYPNQVRSAIVWQGTTFAVIGLVIGVPFGVLLGRFAWRLVADGIGVSAVATIPPIALLLLIPVAIVLVDLVALVRANAPARTRPAVALQAE